MEKVFDVNSTVVGVPHQELHVPPGHLFPLWHPPTPQVAGGPPQTDPLEDFTPGETLV